jgi:trehalose 6-phosphate synthase/phosphatase
MCRPLAQMLAIPLHFSPAAGFNTQDYLRHFVSAAVRILGVEAGSRGVWVPRAQPSQQPTLAGGAAAAMTADATTALTPPALRHFVRLTVHPAGIDPSPFFAALAQPEARERVSRLRSRFGGRRVLLGVDNLETVAGLGVKLLAFDAMLAAHPEQRSGCVLIEVTTPPRRALIGDNADALLAEVSTEEGVAVAEEECARCSRSVRAEASLDLVGSSGRIEGGWKRQQT